MRLSYRINEETDVYKRQSIDCVYFDSPPHTSIEAKNKVIALTRILNTYSFHIRLFVVPFTELQEAIYKNVPDSYIITIMRRMMYRIAERLAIKNKEKIIYGKDE